MEPCFSRSAVNRWMLLSLSIVQLPQVLAAADLPRCIEPNSNTGSASAVEVGDWPLVHTAQFLPVDQRGVVFDGDPAAQIARVLNLLDAALATAESDLSRAVKLSFYVTHREIVSDVQRELAKRFSGAHKPAVSFVVTRLPVAKAVVAVDAVASTKSESGRAVKLISNADKKDRSAAPIAIVPRGSRIYVSGQAKRSESLAEATRQTLESLRATLRFLGRRDADIVQLKAFLMPMSNAKMVQREVATFFGDSPVPPLVLVEWESGASTPIEIELVAWGGRHRSGNAVEYLTPPGMKASPVFSRVACINQSRSIYVSGLYASAHDKSDLDSNSPAAGGREVKEVFASLDRILKQAGSDLRHLVKATYYVSTDSASAKLNELRPNYYDPQRPPAASKAKVNDVGQAGLGLTIDMIAVPGFSADRPEYGPPEYGHGLSASDAAAGWISLFDGRTTFGWKDAKIAEGVLSGGASTVVFGNCELRATFARGGDITVGGHELKVSKGQFRIKETSLDSNKIEPIRLGERVQVQHLAVRPLRLDALFNGRDMTGWKRIDRQSIPEEKRPVWRVEKGALRATGGPGCVEYQGGKYGDMILQLDARTLIRHANGGVFFRAIPGDFMNGYEAQVYSRGEDGDPSRPAVWCTGGIDDRQNARRMVSRDDHFFKMTIIANGPHIATWINGYQQTDFTDDREPNVNARQGRRIEPGVIQLQAHDPGTDVEFKNIAAKKW